MLLEKLLTDMTDEELKEHLAKLRKIHSASAQTRVRSQTNFKTSTQTKSVTAAVKKLDPLKILELAKLLAAKK